jgi:thiamine-phosphate pyrophosphorylase
VTDRKSLAGTPQQASASQLEKIEQAARAGVDWIQIREKDLSGRELAELAGSALRHAGGACRILINDRLDVALALKSGGVHLGERSLPLAEAKRLVAERGAGRDFLVGVSTHSLGAARSAEEAGADYVIFGPVYATPAKAAFGEPHGVERLREVCEKLTIPVLAIGGITLENAGECLATGAGGVAAIRMFQDTSDMEQVVKELRRVI